MVIVNLEREEGATLNYLTRTRIHPSTTFPESEKQIGRRFIDLLSAELGRTLWVTV